MYSEKVMDHFANPRNSGIIENASGEGTVGNPTCGDLMTIYIDVDDNDVIQDIKFETFGCGAAIATSSMITEIAKGMTVDEFDAYVKAYRDTAMDSYTNMTNGQAFYKPMLQVVDYLNANDFTVYIVSGTDRLFRSVR